MIIPFNFSAFRRFNQPIITKALSLNQGDLLNLRKAGEPAKYTFFFRFFSQNGWLKKKLSFSIPLILNFFLQKFQRLLNGLVGLIHAKDIDMAFEAVCCKLQNSLKIQKCIFCPFFDLKYIGQSHNCIGWATSMPFASIKDQSLKFSEKSSCIIICNTVYPW